MKRTATALALAFAAAALLTGASVWEGAAVTAASGELPESGYYVATNAFPRNTVVDVKNLENDKTIRAIVSGGLDSPGLLASLSREAALAIGMNTRDIGRVRMTMPADPIAFARFNEGFEPSGDPDHDPQAAIAAAEAPTDALPAEAAAPADAGSGEEIAPGAAVAPSDAASGESPVDLADAAEDAEPATEATDEIVAADEASASEAKPSGTAAVAAAPVEEMPAEETTASDEDAVAALAAPVESGAPAPVPEDLAEAAPKPEAAPETKAAAPASAPGGEDVAVALVPAGERPPTSADDAGLPADAEVAPLGEAVVSARPTAAKPESAAVPASREGPNFGAPVISDLETGKYYLQLGAFGKAEAVEAEIAKHGKAYPLAIQSSGSVEKPVYRVLVGPVNLGESGALLQRFKRSGYKDAFVKQGGS
jgi:hypothetical protein